MKIAVLFSGQGSQAVGMGKDLYEEYGFVKDLFNKADEVLGTSLKKICFEGPDEELKKTENTQPAVLLVSYICYKLLEQNGIKADAYAGFSLGEYSALTASGVINIEDALKLVSQRGKIIESAYPAGKGGMGAVLGLTDEQVEEICKKVDGIVEPVNYNCPGQLVISGEKDAVEKACDLADEAGAKRTVILNVSGPFHSSLLKSGSDELTKVLDGITFNSLDGKKVVANLTAEDHEDGKIKDILAKHMCSPVLWSKTIEKLIAEGFDTFIEVGPGRVLTGLMRSIDRSKKAISVRDLTSFQKAIEELKSLV